MASKKKKTFSKTPKDELQQFIIDRLNQYTDLKNEAKNQASNNIVDTLLSFKSRYEPNYDEVFGTTNEYKQRLKKIETQISKLLYSLKAMHKITLIDVEHDVSGLWERVSDKYGGQLPNITSDDGEDIRIISILSLYQEALSKKISETQGKRKDLSIVWLLSVLAKTLHDSGVNLSNSKRDRFFKDIASILFVDGDENIDTDIRTFRDNETELSKLH